MNICFSWNSQIQTRLQIQLGNRFIIELNEILCILAHEIMLHSKNFYAEEEKEKELENLNDDKYDN